MALLPSFRGRTAGIAATVICSLTAALAMAGEVDVVGAKVTKSGAGVYRFDVTLKHADAGWDHFANRWDVLDLAGTKLGQRVLAHPHESEQPFTRSARIKIPASVREVTIRGNDSRHGLGGREMRLTIPE